MQTQIRALLVLPVALGVACVSKRDGGSAEAGPSPVLEEVAGYSASAVDTVAAAVVKRLNARDGDGVYALYGKQMRAKFPEDRTRRFVSEVADGVGQIVSSENYLREPALPPRHGKGRVGDLLHGTRSDARLELAVDDDGWITLLRITPAPPEPPVARSTLPLVLPFRGQWYVVWGGETAADNQHVGSGSQRRAADLVIRGPDGKTYRGDGKKNDDYLAHGADVLAVADGTVTAVVDGVAENVPSAMNRYASIGNFVTIRHTDSLYSLYAHLQPGRMRVQVGAGVKAGEVVGACGNSGESSEPHLHFQLQDGPRPEDSWGIEAVFAGVSVTRDGKSEVKTHYALRRGDVVGALEESAKIPPPDR